MYASNDAPQGTKIVSPRRLKTEAEQFRLHQSHLSHLAALDNAAKARGWSSYKAYERAWRLQKAGDDGYAVTLSARWFDQSTKARGSMYARVTLDEPWANFLPLVERRRISVLQDFRILRGDRTRLIATEAYPSWHTCAHSLSKAARQLVFVDTMRVLPASLKKAVKAFRGDPHRMLTSSFPNGDHESVWFDPQSGLHFILNEPYQVNHDKQGPVLAVREMVAFTTREWTIHNPEGTLAQLIGPMQDQGMLETLFQLSKALPARFEKIVFNDDEGRVLPIFK